MSSTMDAKVRSTCYRLWYCYGFLLIYGLILVQHSVEKIWLIYAQCYMQNGHIDASNLSLYSVNT